ncbi:hypothetical protein M011DRAFT_530343 [Sporormia fimetaria CBS 119925]|uniref:FAD-binding FR-type domain-containing protein n=1 Tax=Sporormia fimetaria CBS 119925 TaxID=1340428 RepID=A0A6A6UV76_9PLEO|nr:hypothetical protein M011DRAFT_530343 [Sporormia fimetaria CBS 119925]
MEVITVYILSLASAAGCIILWNLRKLVDQATIRLILSVFRKQFIYTLVSSRGKSTSNINILAAISVLIMAAANVVACVLGVSDWTTLARRCASLFVLNAIPLYAGGRTNLFVDKVLRLSINNYYLFHRWLGRICVLQGLVHGIVSAVRVSNKIGVKEISLLCLLAALGGFSIIYVRHYIYEIFLKAHFAVALSLLAMIWIHARHAKGPTIIALSVSTSLWLIQNLACLAQLIYRNAGGRGPQEMTVIKYSSDSGLEALEITVPLKRRWAVKPGQYIYLTVPKLAPREGSFVQSHPYVIAWAEGSNIILLVQKCRGFTRSLFSSSDQLSCRIDGPYGRIRSLDSYDKVCLIASGIGIAAHLLTLKHLLQAHYKQTCRVRRLTLVWFLESTDQEKWASKYLEELRQEDKRRERGVFTLALYLPADGNTHPAEERYRRTTDNLDILWYIEKEYAADAGNMAVSALVHRQPEVPQGNYALAFLACQSVPRGTQCWWRRPGQAYLPKGCDSARYTRLAWSLPVPQSYNYLAGNPQEEMGVPILKMPMQATSPRSKKRRERSKQRREREILRELEREILCPSPSVPVCRERSKKRGEREILCPSPSVPVTPRQQANQIAPVPGTTFALTGFPKNTVGLPEVLHITVPELAPGQATTAAGTYPEVFRTLHVIPGTSHLDATAARLNGFLPSEVAHASCLLLRGSRWCPLA